MSAATIKRTSTMEEILGAYPGAKRALFTRYHIGGCSSCGFQPTETLEQVLSRHNVLDVEEVVTHLQQAEEVDRKIQISAQEVAGLVKDGKAKLIDVRSEYEHELAHIEGAQLATQELVQELMRGPKDATIVFHCHHGIRSLDAAAYFIGHGFTNVRSMKGGIDAWSTDVDAKVPRYQG